MTNNSTLKEFNEMFDLPDNTNDDNEQAEEYGHSVNNDESFKDLVKDFSEEVSQCPDKGAELVVEKIEDPHDIVKDVCLKEYSKDEHIQEEQEVRENPILESYEQDDDFDTLPEQEVSPQEVLEEIKKAHESSPHIPNEETEKTLEKIDKKFRMRSR